MDGAELLNRYRPRPGARVFEIEAVVLKRRTDGLRSGIVAVERNGAVPVRQKVDAVIYPHGIEVVGILTGDLRHARIGKPRNPNGRGAPAAIAFPDFKGVIERH